MPARPLERYVREWVIAMAENLALGIRPEGKKSATNGLPSKAEESTILRLADNWDRLPAVERKESLLLLIDRIYVRRGASARSPDKDKRVLVVATWHDDPPSWQRWAGIAGTTQAARTRTEPGGTRPMILDILSRHPATVSELATALSVSVPSITKQLRRLMDDDLVLIDGTRRVGKTTARVFVANEQEWRATTDVQSSNFQVAATDTMRYYVTGPRQVDVLRLLAKRSRTAHDISERLGFTETNGRKHLQLLNRRGLIATVGSMPSERGRPAKRYELTQRGRQALASMHDEEDDRAPSPGAT